MLYEKDNCDSVLDSQPWDSCCQPAMGVEGSGGYIKNYSSGVYSVKTGAFSKSQVYCDMETERGGWLTILRRTQSANTIEFDKFQEHYENGFGDLNGEFWLGLRTMHQLTKNGDCEMRVDLYDEVDSNVAYIYYDLFKVDHFPEYTLHLGKSNRSNSSLTDSLRQFNGQKFTVSKHELDNKQDTMCAQGRGGWWYINNVCSQQGSVLTNSADELEWWVTDKEQTIKKQKFNRYEMKIRPKNCVLKELGT